MKLCVMYRVAPYAFVALILLSAVLPASAAVLNVPADYLSVQDAVNAAAAGDEVVLARGMTHSSGYSGLTFPAKAITLRSEDPDDPAVVADTILTGAGGSADAPVIKVEGGVTRAATITGLTISDGDTGILTYGSPTISKNIIRNNWAKYSGGGIICHGSSPLISGNTIRNNTAYSDGGGIVTTGGLPEIISNTIIDNLARGLSGWGYAYGGGGIAANGKVWIIGNTIRNNKSDRWGGGIMLMGSYKPIVKYNLITGNQAGTDPGERGGGILCSAVQYALIQGNTISGNGARLGGNFYYGFPNSIQIVDCIISFATRGYGIYRDIGSQSMSISYSDVYGNVGGDYYGGDVMTGIDGNISEDPLFADAAGNDFHLKSMAGRWNPLLGMWVRDPVNSPCIDAGDPASPYDQEPMPNGGRVDMGGYGNNEEASKGAAEGGGNSPPTAPTVAAISPDTPVTADDLTLTYGGASDPEGASLSYQIQWSSNGGAAWADGSSVLPASQTTKGQTWQARVCASDGELTSEWRLSGPVTIANSSPTADAGLDQTVEGNKAGGADVTLSGSSSDADDDAVSYLWSWTDAEGDVQTASGADSTVFLPLGETTVTLVVNDGEVASAPDTLLVTVTDTTEPTVASFSVDQPTLWLSNGKMSDVTLDYDISDLVDTGATVTIGVTCNEGSYDASRDMEIVDDNHLRLRAKREGTSKEGRIYTITITVTDASGNSAVATVTVTVPHDNRRVKTAMIGSAQAVSTARGAQITYVLSGEANVSVSIANIAGRPVRSLLADRTSAAGINSVTWDGRSTAGVRVPGGTYLVNITAHGSDGSSSRTTTTLQLTR